MIAREDLIKKISQQLAHLANVTKIQNKQGYFDINKSAEDLFAGLLNLAFNMHLSNENKIKSNYPAIDLSDRKNRVCFQITSETANQKIRETLEKFKANRLDQEFEILVFLIISVEVKPTCAIPQYARIINISDLAKKIKDECEDDALPQILSFLESKLGGMAHEQTILPSNTVPTFINSPKPDLLINRLRYTEDDQQYIDELIADLKSLAQALGNLTLNQREYLYYVVENGKSYQPCGGPVVIIASDLEQRFGRLGHAIFEVLESRGLLGVDSEFEINDRVTTIVFAKYWGISGEVNLFHEFKIHFPQSLRAIIVGVNFSCLSSHN